MNAKGLSVRATQTRDDWILTLTLQVDGLQSKAACAYLAGGLSGAIFAHGVRPPKAGVDHNFDNDQPEGKK